MQVVGSAEPKSAHDKMDDIWPHSIRYGKEAGTIGLIYIVSLSYCAASPIILPVALIYFITSWIFWRYSVLYVWERCYESGGRMWDTFFNQMMWCLFILQLFTGMLCSLLLPSSPRARANRRPCCSALVLKEVGELSMVHWKVSIF
jgi:Calcium-dependent channel, 7TM region, putative phosphate